MPLYFRTGVGPIRYSHRLGGQRRRRHVRPDSPMMERAKVTAALVITIVCAAVLIAALVAWL
jgi:hypothetical protein